MRQLLIFCLLLTSFPFHVICFTANEKARHFISNLLEDHGLKNRTKRQTRVKTQFPVVPNYWRHNPDNPQFDQLIGQLSQIIPGQSARADFSNPNTVKRKARQVIKDLRKESGEDVKLMSKLDDIESLLHKTKSSSGSIVVDKLNDLFIYLEEIQGHHGHSDNDPWSKAPFTSLGSDCFADVDHKEYSWEIRRIALSMAKYIEYRQLEHENPSYDSNGCSGCDEKLRYQTDALMTQMVAMLDKMHRATLRNWNQILMVIGQFAYTQESGIDDLLHKSKHLFSTPDFLISID